MKQRIITGIIGGAGFIFLVWLGSIPYSVLIASLAVLAYYEYLKMDNAKIFSIEGLIGFIAVLLIVSFENNPVISLSGDLISVILISLIIYLILIVLKKNKITFDKVGYYLLGILYIGFGFSYMLTTRLDENGLYLTLLVLFATWSSDSGAYFTGKYLGKRKLWPAISPNKTIEGALGAIFFSVLASLLINYLFGINESLLYSVFVGITISVVGQMGDLVESALKRSKDIKDSGTLIPGHGGVLDRFDSLIFVFPILQILHIL